MVKHAQFLNKMESWRGLNKIRKRGKYVTVCPEVENLHKRPKCNNFLPLLTNGNSLPPVRVWSKYMMVKDTCPGWG